MTNSGGMKEFGIRTLTPKPGQKIKNVWITFGVDASSPSCDNFADLQFKIYQDDKEIDEDKYKLKEYTSRNKAIMVNLDPEIENGPVTISWQYEWPGGFANLLENYIDVGSFSLQDQFNSLTIEIEIEHPAYILKKLTPTYLHEKDIEYLHEGDERKGGFRLKNPPRTGELDYKIWIEPSTR